jgi:hypothetical protein
VTAEDASAVPDPSCGAFLQAMLMLSTARKTDDLLA